MACTPFFLKMTILLTVPLGLQIVCITCCNKKWNFKFCLCLLQRLRFKGYEYILGYYKVKVINGYIILLVIFY